MGLKAHIFVLLLICLSFSTPMNQHLVIQSGGSPPLSLLNFTISPGESMNVTITSQQAFIVGIDSAALMQGRPGPSKSLGHPGGTASYRVDMAPGDYYLKLGWNPASSEQIVIDVIIWSPQTTSTSSSSSINYGAWAVLVAVIPIIGLGVSRFFKSSPPRFDTSEEEDEYKKEMARERARIDVQKEFGNDRRK